MITRAQAEALLKLATALDVCGACGLSLNVPGRCNIVLQGTGMDECLDLETGSDAVSATQLRLLVSDLVPKHTGS